LSSPPRRLGPPPPAAAEAFAAGRGGRLRLSSAPLAGNPPILL